MCILVGASGCGKTSIARTAAQLAGRHLTELALTGGTDTADLLGGFEQLEPKRKVQVRGCCLYNCSSAFKLASSAVLLCLPGNQCECMKQHHKGAVYVPATQDKHCALSDAHRRICRISLHNFWDAPKIPAPTLPPSIDEFSSAAQWSMRF